MTDQLCIGDPLENRTGDNLLPLSTFQDEEGNWREDWPTIPAFTVCFTPGCVLQGVENFTVLTENVDGRYRSSCGPCGQENTRYHAVPCPGEGTGGD